MKTFAFLDNNMDEFLESIRKTELRSELSDWQQWHKLEPLTFAEKQAIADKQPDIKILPSKMNG